MKLLSVKKSDRSDKKWTATFCMCKGETSCCSKERKKVHFGATGYGDYTLTKDKAQRARYRSRHAKEKHQAADTPGALAYWILWGDSTSMQENIANFKKKFNV